MHLTDAILRRLAWSAFALCCVFLAAAVAVGLTGEITSAGGADFAADQVAFVVIIFTFPVVGLLITRR